MSEIIPFVHNADNQLPAHLANVFGEEGNIAPRVSIDQLSYRGKVWRRVVKGEEVQLTRTNQETGEVEPIPIVQVVLLDHNKNRSRSFFEGNYEEGKSQPPRCYSGDGVKPDASVTDPISPTCATCPNAVKGSKITESGKQSTLCSPFKRVAVVPSANIGQHPVMLLKLAQTSIWDKDNPEEAKGWYAWDNYLDMLRSRGAKHTGMVETRIKFDLRVAYPKLLFQAARWFSPEEALAVRQLLETQKDAIDTIINGAGNTDGTMVPPAGAGEADATVGVAATNGAKAPTPAPTPAATPAPTSAAAKPKTPPKPPAATPAPAAKTVTKKIDLDKTDGFSLEQMIEAGWTEEGLIAAGMLTVVEEVATPKAPPKPPATPKKPPTPPTPPAPAASNDDSGFAAAPPPPAAQAPAPAAAAAGVVADTPAGLSELLSGWDDGEA